MRKNLLNSILATALIILPFLPFANSSEIFQPFLGEINTDGINVRCDSTVSSESISVLNKGERVEAVAELYDWYKIRLPKNSASYIKRSFLECISHKTVEPPGVKEPQPQKECSSARLLRDRVNVRLHPNTSSKIVGVINKDEVVNILGEEGEWSRIEPIANSYGYVNKNFVSKLSATKTCPLREESISIIGTIKSSTRLFRGTSYRLTTPDNRIFLLKGDKKSLEALCNKNAKVTGKIISTAGQESPLIEVRVLEVVN